LITLESFKLSLGDALDAAMLGIGFSVPNAQYTDIGSIEEVDELPAIIYTWSLTPERDMVLDVDVEKDYTTDPAKPTATATERLPHKMEISVRVASEVLWEADAMRDGMLTEFGNAPCAGLPLYYGGFSDKANMFKTGIFQYLFTYTAHIFLNGRSETDPIMTTVKVEISSTAGSGIEENTEEEDDDGDPDVPTGAVTISEVVCEVLTRP